MSRTQATRKGSVKFQLGQAIERINTALGHLENDPGLAGLASECEALTVIAQYLAGAQARVDLYKPRVQPDGARQAAQVERIAQQSQPAVLPAKPAIGVRESQARGQATLDAIRAHKSA